MVLSASMMLQLDLCSSDDPSCSHRVVGRRAVHQRTDVLISVAARAIGSELHPTVDGDTYIRGDDGATSYHTDVHFL